MGGHAFHHLHCPRIPPDLYLRVRQQTTTHLQQIFAHVVVPTELPSKLDYGDVDFLVAAPLHASPTAAVDWPTMVTKIKEAFGTAHGRRGILNPDCMYFALPVSNPENNTKEFFVQIDVKVCEDATFFDWECFRLHYASASKIVGSMIKPLGLTIAPEGLHVRVEEIERTNLAGSMVFLTKEPLDVLKIVDLDRRILNAEFKDIEQLYSYIASSCFFHPEHFAERLKSDKYALHLEHRSVHWVSFVTDWIPEHYSEYGPPFTEPGYDASSPYALAAALKTWYSNTRVLARDKVFTMFPSAASTYYNKRQTHLKEMEERRLRELLMSVIPVDHTGWTNDLPTPRINIKSAAPATLEPKLLILSTDTCIPTGIIPSPSSKAAHNTLDIPLALTCSYPSISPISNDHFTPPSPDSTPLLLEALPREPPIPHTPRPPPSSMSLESRLVCLARWTLFHPRTGTLYLAQEPREKKFTMAWADSGATDEVLVSWAQEMWYKVWVRQGWVNWRGMWRRKLEKGEERGLKAREEVKKDEEARKKEEREAAGKVAVREKILGRLRVLNEGNGLVSPVG